MASLDTIDVGQLEQYIKNIGDQTSQLWWTNYYLQNLGNSLGGLNLSGLSQIPSAVNNLSTNITNEFSGIGQSIAGLSSGISTIGPNIGAFGNAFNQNLTNIGNAVNQDIAGIGQVLGTAEGTFTNISNTFGQIGTEVAAVGNTINAIQNWDWKTIAIRGGLILVGIIVLTIGIAKL
jgi:phage-related protein